jgi:hypothetical protein
MAKYRSNASSVRQITISIPTSWGISAKRRNIADRFWPFALKPSFFSGIHHWKSVAAYRPNGRNAVVSHGSGKRIVAFTACFTTVKTVFVTFWYKLETKKVWQHLLS